MSSAISSSADLPMMIVIVQVGLLLLVLALGLAARKSRAATAVAWASTLLALAAIAVAGITIGADGSPAGAIVGAAAAFVAVTPQVPAVVAVSVDPLLMAQPAPAVLIAYVTSPPPEPPEVVSWSDEPTVSDVELEMSSGACGCAGTVTETV